jgi:hypothetical protein
MGKAQEAIGQLSEAKKAAQTLIDAEADLKKDREDLERERVQVSAGTGSKEEVLAGIDSTVDQAAAEFQKRFAGTIANAAGGAPRFDGTGRTERDRPRLPKFGDGTLDFTTLCGLVPDLVKARLRECVASGVRFGLTRAQRAVRLAEIERALEEVKRDQETLVREAYAVGVRLPGWADVESQDAAKERGGMVPVGVRSVS